MYISDATFDNGKCSSVKVTVSPHSERNETERAF